MALEALGSYTVETASSGTDGLSAVNRFAPDLILLDVMMPGMTGPEVITTLKADQETASIPVVFMTAKVQPSEVARLRELGALEVIAKPFDPMALASTIQGIWDQHV
jgi:CheY-like chemotaxis protein